MRGSVEPTLEAITATGGVIDSALRPIGLKWFSSRLPTWIVRVMVTPDIAIEALVGINYGKGGKKRNSQPIGSARDRGL